MIRLATVNDANEVLRMARSFHAVSGYDQIPFDEDTCFDLFVASVSQELCFVAEKDGGLIGFVLGLAAPAVLNKNYLMGAEIAWWVDPQHRGSVGLRLLKKIEKQAEDIGVKCWSMMALEDQNPESVEKIYLKSGYKKTERTYSRFH